MRSITGFLCVFILSISVAYAEALIISPLEREQSLFTGQNVKLSYSINGGSRWQGMVEWRLKAGGRTIRQGRQNISSAKSNNGVFSIALTVPALKAQLIIDATLEIVFINEITQKEVFFERDILLFGADPYVSQRVWLRDLDIYLYDPIGNTEKVLHAAGIPLTRINNLDRSLEGFNGLLIIGEAVSVKDVQVLRLLQLVRSGASVIGLSLADTDFPVDFQNSVSDRPVELILSDHGVIERLNKKLASANWINEHSSISSSVSIDGDRAGARLRIQQGESGWPWMEMSFPDQTSKLLFVGFPIIKDWNRSPVPRFIFKELLLYVSKKKLTEINH